jgi:hypothetical protein
MAAPWTKSYYGEKARYTINHSIPLWFSYICKSQRITKIYSLLIRPRNVHFFKVRHVSSRDTVPFKNFLICLESNDHLPYRAGRGSSVDCHPKNSVLERTDITKIALFVETIAAEENSIKIRLCNMLNISVIPLDAQVQCFLYKTTGHVCLIHIKLI